LPYCFYRHKNSTAKYWPVLTILQLKLIYLKATGFRAAKKPYFCAPLKAASESEKMTYDIQPEFDCRHCVKCGRRPVIEQVKKTFKIKCPNKDCNNVLSGFILNFDKWNEQNKTGTSIKEDKDTFKRTA